MVVPHSLWSQYVCHELGGAGWEAVVVRLTKHTATVRFVHARARGGRRYEDEQLPIEKLKEIT